MVAPSHSSCLSRSATTDSWESKSSGWHFPSLNFSSLNFRSPHPTVPLEPFLHCSCPGVPPLGTPLRTKLACPVVPPVLEGLCSKGTAEPAAQPGAHLSLQLRRQSVKQEEAAGGSKPSPETEQKEEDTKPAAPSTEEKSQLRGDWRLYRGHHPLSFLGLEDPLFLRHNLYRSPAFEPECPLPRKSAFAPYNRRVSEGSYRFSPEAMYSRAYYTNLYSPALKKD